VTAVQEPDSLPRSEALPRPVVSATPASLPDWQRCEVHRVSFLFECRVCDGAVFGYGD
jgi:hypothetical protein